MDNISKCKNCGKSFIAEELLEHDCQLRITEIPILYYFTVKKNKEDVLLVRDIENRLYRFVKLSPENQHPKKSPEDSTESKQALNRHLS